MNFNRLKTLFTLLIAVSSSLTLAIGIATAWQMAKLEGKINYELDVSEKLIEGLGELKLQVVQIQQFLTDSAATGEADGQEEARKAMQAAKAALAAIVTADSGYSGEARELEQGAQRLYDTGLKMVAAYGTGREAGNEFMKSPDGFDKQSDALQEKVDAIAKHITTQQREANMQVTAAIRLTRTLNLTLSAILIVVIVGISVFTYRRVLGIVGAEPEIGARLTQYMAQGELGRNIDLRQGDDESLLARLSQMKARWTDVVAGLRGQSEILALASTELAERSHRMSTDSQAQSDTANGIAASVEQFTISIEEIAAKAREANGNVKRTGEASASASRVIEHIATEVQQVAITVQQSATQVGELDTSTRAIATVVELIRDVADQTNLIALNAAIEAARAGEAGRGFAVVADEVRKLAERTTQSTADITRRIDEVHDVAERIVESIGLSVQRVEASVALSREALESMASVRGQAAEASRQVGEIDLALDEQRAGAHQITSSVEGIARMAESNAEGARVVSSHSDRIDEIAKAIDAEVGYFKLAQRGNDQSNVLF